MTIISHARKCSIRFCFTAINRQFITKLSQYYSLRYFVGAAPDSAPLRFVGSKDFAKWFAGGYARGD